MKESAGGARSDDTHGLREAVLGLVRMVVEKRILTPPIDMGSSKSATRGFKHPDLGRLLCPINHLQAFDANPEMQVLFFCFIFIS
jgi:hypothetical protein